MLHCLSLCPLSQVLGKKPQLPEGDNDDDTVADLSNRKMAKLYMVSAWGWNFKFSSGKTVPTLVECILPL